MRVTFDTNVWNRMVFPERYVNSANYLSLAAIKNAIRSGQLRGFISEGFGTVEAVKRANRAKFHAQNVPNVEVTNKSYGHGLHCMTIEINANHSLHPGIGEEFEEELNEALAIGIKLLPTPYIGLPVPDRLRNNPHIYAEGVFEQADYNERFGDVVRTIVGRGVGEGVFPALAKEFTARLDGPRPTSLSDRALIYAVYQYACASGLGKEKKQIEKAFAESADGDLVAAHIAFGNDYLCTEDRGGTAVSPSIFDAENRAWLKTEYGVEILDVQRLAHLL
ncbi:MAG TPA: hypothetical protein VNW97_18305 [Candidatus Saccharimonadales bacterium]|jgi:hypothetical protein|nr:hypothetical protein [Candidatus Saccharimonadales bacterium]